MRFRRDQMGDHHREAPDGERGASLMLAMAFLLVVAVATAALIGFASTSANLESGYDEQRIERYAGDAAVEAAIEWAARRPNVGIQGAGAETCFLASPATDPAPEVVTTCAPNDGSGATTESGLVPQYAILTTGQRQNEAPGYRGPTSTPTYNGPTCTNPPGPTGPGGGDPREQRARGQARIEQGIRFAPTPVEEANPTTTPANDPCQSASPVSRLLLTGDTYSGSGIEVAPGGEFDVVGGSVVARGSCNFVLTACSSGVDTTDADPMDPSSSVDGHDPRTDPAPDGSYSPSSWSLPNVSSLPARTVPSAGTCTANGLVVLEPGFYDSVGDLNDLFKNPACATSTFWFKPDPGADGVIDAPDDPTPDDKRGTYYFDFRGTSTGGQCGRYTNISGSVTNAHQWCIGNDGTYNQRVVGGSPYEWTQAAWATRKASFPREITPDDVGGDCDETKPGVEFVFGGDSHVYVADGSLELCAGPPDSTGAPEDRQRIALYNVPAIQPARATGATAVAAPTGEPSAGQSTATLTDPTNALRVAEPSSPVAGQGKSTTINIPNTQCAVDNNGSSCPTAERYRAGAVRLSYPGVSLPSGTTIKRVLARATYNTTSATAAAGETPVSASVLLPDPHPLLAVGSCTAEPFPTTPNNSTYDMLAIKDVTSCFSGGVGSSFNATWITRETEVCTSFGCNGPWTNTLDGIEFIVEVQSTGSTPTLVPASGCVAGWAPNVVDANSDNIFDTVTSGGANYWNVQNDGDTTCALLKVDQRRYNDAVTANYSVCGSTTGSSPGFGRPYYCGRASIKGTVYAPSAVVDISDEDVLYAIFNRGIVVRSLMLRGLRYASPVPFADAPEVDTGPGARDVTFVSCLRAAGREDEESACSAADGDRILTRARVRYEVDASAPPAERARIPTVQWWRSER